VVIIMMGAAGAGKTTIGRALAAELGWRFFDADDYHTAASIAKMRAGQPLTDADRAPWIATLGTIVARASDRREHAVLACSAL
jgi:gluconokinase